MEHAREQPAVSLEWSNTADVARDAARFAGRVIGSDDRYISHGEIQTGLSPDGRHWAEDLTALYEEDFAELGGDRDLLVSRDATGSIVGIAIVAWEQTSRRAFAVLEDMAVEPALRSLGVGDRLLDAVQDRVEARGLRWLFLESGGDNAGAHRFFERNGFKAISHVFGKQVGEVTTSANSRAYR